ncbi:MAG: hypothetical protein HRT66_07665 [Flavobacteriaceae bacterium]|nr:hypothetical protein [Flavobacteriaceae bacterium]
MDKLTYNYKPNINQLTHVTDHAIAETGLDDIKTQSTDNYVYNSIGQLVSNEQDDITYTYNTAGLVTQINQTSTGNIAVKFIYDDKGKRMVKEA